MSKVPLTKVTLYKHGIGYFERRGAVNGPGSIELQCGPDEIDDMLKSLLVLKKGGGKVSAITYESSKPLYERLEEFGFDLKSCEGFAELISQIKGTPVAVNAQGKSISGRVVGLDTTQKIIGSAVCYERFLLVLTAENVLTRIDTAIIDGVEVKDESLASELQQQLELLFLSVKKKDRKLLNVDIPDEGEQNLIIAYSIPCPIWKTSYRLMFDHEERLLLQGVAIVDNVQDEDWNDVQIVLVSASPVSFIQPLYEPIKPTRRTIAGQGVQSTGPFVAERAAKKRGRAAAAPQEADMYSTGGYPQQEGFMQMVPGAPPAPAAAMGLARPAAPGYGGAGAYGSVGDHIDELSEQSLNLASVEKGENFEYHIGGTVTVPRNSSALIPVVQEIIEGERLSLYQETRNPDFPYATVKLKNTTGLTLEAGPVTVMEDESYAGEGLLDVIKPDDTRFIPYALDQSVSVIARSDFERKPVWRVQVQDALLFLYHKEITRKTYNIENLSNKKKIIYIEHPASEGWKLIGSEKPIETTKNFYRFRIELDGKEDYKLVVNQERPVTTQIHLGGISHDPNQLRWLFEQNFNNKKFLEFMKQVQAVRNDLYSLQVQMNNLHQQQSEAEAEQERARKNVKTLGGEGGRFKQAIEDSEDKIIAAQKAIQEMNLKIQEKTNELNSILRVRIEADILDVPVDA